VTRYYFGKEAAEALIGQRVRSLVEYRGVRKGITGKVVRIEPQPDGQTYRIGVEWDLPYSGKPPVDWFSRDEYLTKLEEIA
jgi:hypothetical protein